jgi:hypothetical protein
MDIALPSFYKTCLKKMRWFVGNGFYVYGKLLAGSWYSSAKYTKCLQFWYFIPAYNDIDGNTPTFTHTGSGFGIKSPWFSY